MNDFDEVAYEAFLDAATDKYDFTTCQRPDGSKYGSSGRCLKGTESSPASQDKKTSSKKSGGGSSGEYRTRPKGAIESDMKKLTSSGAMNQKGIAGVKAREEHARLKAELKKPLKGANSKSGGSATDQARNSSDPTVRNRVIDQDIKKASNQYKKLQGDPTKSAERKALSDEIAKLERIKKTNEEEARLRKAYGRDRGTGNSMDKLTSEDVMRVAGTQD